jgi:hypothetical protein
MPAPNLRNGTFPVLAFSVNLMAAAQVPIGASSRVWKDHAGDTVNSL